MGAGKVFFWGDAQIKYFASGGAHMSYLMRVYMENFRCTPRTTVYARVKDLAYNLHMCNLCRTFEANCTCRFFLFHAQQTVFNKYTKF